MTVAHITEKDLALASKHMICALGLAYEMLCEIQAGNNFDTVDFIQRKNAIDAAIHTGK